MNDQTITQSKTEIRLTRDYDFYFHTVRMNGHTAPRNRIDRARAMQIYEAYPADQWETVGSDPVDFTPGGAKQFTCKIEIEEGDDGE